jgi:hypothetical protein
MMTRRQAFVPDAPAAAAERADAPPAAAGKPEPKAAAPAAAAADKTIHVVIRLVPEKHAPAPAAPRNGAKTVQP